MFQDGPFYLDMLQKLNSISDESVNILETLKE